MKVLSKAKEPFAFCYDGLICKRLDSTCLVGLGKQSSWGQVLNAMVGILKKHFKTSWTEHVSVYYPEQLDPSLNPWLQRDIWPPLMLVVLLLVCTTKKFLVVSVCLVCVKFHVLSLYVHVFGASFRCDGGSS